MTHRASHRLITRRISTRKLLAIAAAGLIAVTAATASSLAAWTDTEWVFGSASGANAVSTSKFSVQQNTSAGNADTDWSDRADSANGGSLGFVGNAADLTPGDTLYGQVRLRTTIGSTSGFVVMKPAVKGTGTDTGLFNALTFGARVMPTAASCNSTSFANTGDVIIPDNTLVSSSIDATSFNLDAATAQAAGAEKTVCIAMTLPQGSPTSLQGKAALPMWQFVSTSN